MERDWEGCLSIPGLRGLVPRHHRILALWAGRRRKRLRGGTARLCRAGVSARVGPLERNFIFWTAWKACATWRPRGVRQNDGGTGTRDEIFPLFSADPPMKLISIAGLCAALYAGAGALLWAAQDRLIFHPRAVPPDKRRQFENLQIQFPMPDGAILRGWMRPADTPPARKRPLPTRSLLRRKLRRGLRKHPTSPSRPRRPTPHQLPRIRRQRRKTLQPRLGTGRPATLRPSRRPLCNPPRKNMRLRAQFGNAHGRLCRRASSGRPRCAHFPLRQRPEHRPKTIPRFSRPRVAAPSFATGDFAERVRAPTLFILAENDWIVPRRRSDALIKMWKAPRQIVVVPNSTHNDFDAPEYRGAVYDFLSGQ